MIRLDRAITLYITSAMNAAMTTRCRRRLPILMYHSIRDRLEGRGSYYETTTSPAVFARHMECLQRRGYETVDLGSSVSLLAGGADLSRRVVITFDDGYRDFYTHAYPILDRFAFSATLFVPTHRIGTERRCLDGKEYLTWAEVTELHAAGIRIGSHTVTHPELKVLPAPEVDRELGKSKQIIEDRLGASVTSFAYPYAFPERARSFVRQIGTMLAEHGYENGVTTIIGTASAGSDRYFLPRLPVNDWDDERLLAAKLEGAYDWLHTPQILNKAVKDLARFHPSGRVTPAGPAG